MARNYMAHGGSELVIAGALTILPGAVVTGLERATGGIAVSSIEDSTATTVAALREDFNRLLAVLRNGGPADVSVPDPGGGG